MIERLSKDFTVAEFIKSQIAERLGLNNDMPPEALENARYLVKKGLQPLRELIGRPIVIPSGYRSKAVNKAAGGVATSQHMLGQAADIECPGMSNYELASLIYKNFPYDQLILEYVDDAKPGSGWVHWSLKKEGNRGEALQVNKSGTKAWKPK